MSRTLVSWNIPAVQHKSPSASTRWSGGDSFGESPVQPVHLVVSRIEMSLELFQIAGKLRRLGRPLKSTSVLVLVTWVGEGVLNEGGRLSNSSNVWVGHHTHAPFRVVAVETKSDVGEILGLEERLRDLKTPLVASIRYGT